MRAPTPRVSLTVPQGTRRWQSGLVGRWKMRSLRPLLRRPWEVDAKSLRLTCSVASMPGTSPHMPSLPRSRLLPLLLPLIPLPLLPLPLLPLPLLPPL